MVIVFSSLVMVFSDLALGAALVQRKQLTDSERNTVFWTSVSAGLTFTVLGIACAPLIAAFYGEHAVQALLMVLSATFLISSLATTTEALLVRDMNFGKVETRRMIAMVLGAVAGIVTALLGGGAWAIISQQVATELAGTVLLLIISPFRIRPMFSRAALREMGGFSGFILGHRLLFYLHRNADNLLIGRFIGAAALGAYTIAYNVMLVPFSRIAGPVQKVMFPAFSRLQDQPERIAALWVRATRLVGALTVPMLCGLVVIAPDFVDVVLGHKWESAVPLIQVLAWVGLLQSLQTLNTEILSARDRTPVLFKFSIGFFCAHVTAFIIGIQFGIVGMAVAYAISSTLVEPIITWLAARSLHTTPLIILKGLAGVAFASAVMVAAVFAVRHALVAADVPALARLVLCVATGVVVYLPVVAVVDGALRREVLGLAGGLSRRRRMAPQAA
jgi:O-antigen/teichoic acid export membrane protein